MEKVINNIKRIRQKKGFSHEYIAHELNISQAAYSKLENSETKLSVERLYKIGEILESSVLELLNIEPKKVFKQTNHDQSIGSVENLYQENKEKTEKIIQLYEQRLKDKDQFIENLQSQLKST